MPKQKKQKIKKRQDKDDIKSHLCWGILFHLQGRQKEAEKELREVKNSQKAPDAFRSLSSKLITYIGYGPTEGLDNKVLLKRSRILLMLIRDIDKILNPIALNNPRLAYECLRNSNPGKSNESPEKGYSRDPFKRIKRKFRADIALATMLYLLRGYASFFCRPRNRRDFNAAKVALNDFFQCGLLIWRLYRSLDTCHSKKGSQAEYLEMVKMVKDKIDTSEFPEHSPYFVWSTLLMLEIQRGNVYRQIDYLDEANRFYRQAQERLKRLLRTKDDPLSLDISKTIGSKWAVFITPTVVRAISERSKVQFDLGYFLESLINHTLCLVYLAKAEGLKPASENSKERNKLFENVSNVLEFLDSERRQSVFDKDLIRAYYGYPYEERQKPSSITTIKPSDFVNLISDENLEFAADVLARIGFTLFTLGRRYFPFRGKITTEVKAAKDDEVKSNRWLEDYFAAHKMFSSKTRKVGESRLAAYCMTLVGLKAGDETDPGESPEKLFAKHLRQIVDQRILEKDNLDRGQFYQAILAATTQNILNVATIPRRNQRLLMRRGYRFRREQGDLSQSSVFEGILVALGLNPPPETTKTRVQNKLVVLRRWQSTNPKFPRPGERKLRGGGYFLLWQGKGIVIDPGYDFIQNFYDEGFSLGDIDAVLVTHSHPDHDDDLSTLTTLIREWNEYHKLIGECEKRYGTKELDFFLNESANLKFSAWLKSSQVDIGRVIPLPSVWWDKDSKRPAEGRIRGEPVRMNLRNILKPEEGYNLEIEVMPAWHDDVIGKTEAVGIKFHLYEPELHKKIGIIGYTGDTGAYGYDLANLNRGGDRIIEDLYADCDILIGHLGDIKMRELTTILELAAGDNHPIQRLFEDWFGKPDDREKITLPRVRDFIKFLIALDLVPSKALLAELKLSGDQSYTLCEWLEKLFEEEAPLACKRKDFEKELQLAYTNIFDDLGFPDINRRRTAIEDKITQRIHEAIGGPGPSTSIDRTRVVWTLLGFLCGFAMAPWQYPYHLGIFGIHLLFQRLVNYWKEQRIDGRLFVVGELPEELASYRHVVARLLNSVEDNLRKQGEARRWVHAFTGDVGLHVSLGHDKRKLIPKIRCAYCNYNNETVLKVIGGQDNYHLPSKIVETALKRLNSAMIYLCTEYDHHPEVEHFPRHFLSRPILRVV